MSIELRRSVVGANLSDDVGAGVEALTQLGFEDRDRLQEEVADDYRALGSAGKTGERFIKLPRTLVPLPQIIEVLDGGNYSKSYAPTYVYEELWTPDYAGEDGLELGNKAQGRLALHSSSSPKEPLLHFLDQPFDERYAEEGEETQLQALENAKQAYEAANPEFNMVPLAAEDLAFIALTRRIKGEPMPLEWGYMRDATRPRKMADGVSWVGGVHSDRGRLAFAGSYGRADSGSGVGLSVGPKQD